MNIKPNLESLEDRCLLNATDVTAFQQQVPALHAELVAIEPSIQAGLRNFVNSVKTQVIPQQLAVAQYIVDNFPQLTEAWFIQQVQTEENYLLQINNPPQASSTGNTNWIYDPAYQYVPGNIYYITPIISPTPMPQSSPIDPTPPNPTPDPLPDEPPDPGPDNPVY